MFMNRNFLHSICILIFTILPSLLVSQIYSIDDSKLILVGQGPVEIGPIVIKNTSKLILSSKDKITFKIPRQMKCDWESCKITIDNKAGLSKEIQPKIKGRKLSFRIPFELEIFETLTISGLKLRNLYKPVFKASIQIYLNDDRCEKESLIFTKIWRNIKNINRLQKGEYSVVDLNFELSQNAKYIVGNDLSNFPDIIIQLKGKDSQIPADQKIIIIFPTSVSKSLNNAYVRLEGLNGFDKNKCRIRWVQMADKLTAQITFNKKVKGEQGIRLTNLKFHRRSEIFDETSIQLSVGDYDGSTISTGKKVWVCDPYVRLNEYPCLIVNLPPSRLPQIEINTGRSDGALNSGDELCFQLPDDMGLYWDRSNTQVNLDGSASDKLDQKINYMSETTAYLNVTENIYSNETIIINGLKVGIRKKMGEDDKQSYRQKAWLKVMFNGPNRPESEIEVPRDFQIAHFVMKSRQQQEFGVKDPLVTAQQIEIEVKSNFDVFNAGDSLILQLPQSLKMNFAHNQSPVRLSGSMASRVDEVQFLNNKNLILPLKSSISPGLKLKINGIQCEAFESKSHDRPLLFHHDSEFPIAQDERGWMISKPYFSLSSDQVIFDNDERTRSFEIIIHTQDFSNYFMRGKQLRLRIPSNIPVSFSPHMQQCRFDAPTSRFLSSDIGFINDKTIALTIKKNIPENTILRICDVFYDKAQDITIEPFTLYMSLNDGYSYLPNHKNITIVSSRSDCNQADHFCKLTKSNFEAGDTLILFLNGSYILQWDVERTQKSLSIEQSKQFINTNPFFINNDYQTIGFRIKQTLGVNDQIKFKGLALRNLSNRFVEAELQIPYHNLFGTQVCKHIYNQRLEKYRLPITTNDSAKLERVERLLPSRSYHEPMIFTDNESFESLKKGFSGEYFILPELILQNGKISPDHKSINLIFERTLNNVPLLIAGQDMETAEEEALELNKNCPDLWYSYYSLAQVYRENPNRIDEARRLYREAKSKGYTSTNMYPPLFADNADDEMNQYIEEGRLVFNNREYVRAEEKFNLFQGLRDSLNSETIGRSYYWPGRVAYQLRDYGYSLDYFKNSKKYGYTHQETDWRVSTGYLITKSEEMLQDTSGRKETEPNIGPLEINPDEQKTVYVSLQKPDNRRDPVVLRSYNRSKQKINFEEAFVIKDKDRYTLEFKPVQNSIRKFATTLIAGAILCVVMLI